jgi:RimJ/RimL family protein N-acetyltransferase
LGVWSYGNHYDHCVTRTNEFGQPIGDDLLGWREPPRPSRVPLQGSRVGLVPLDTGDHAAQLFEAFAPASAAMWTYMSFGPFADLDELARTLDGLNRLDGWLPYAVVVSGVAVGLASYLRIDPPNGVLEIGSLAFSPSLQRTSAATEALYLMINNCFDLGYRRCEWKCDDLNGPSHSAARRLGFHYEGTFRQATHYKGRTRDTAWYAITDREWPDLGRAFRAWLDPGNFDGSGAQLATLESFQALPRGNG